MKTGKGAKELLQKLREQEDKKIPAAIVIMQKSGKSLCLQTSKDYMTLTSVLRKKKGKKQKGKGRKTPEDMDGVADGKKRLIAPSLFSLYPH